MTSLAQMLVDAGKKVQGSDVEQKFVTEDQLIRLNIAVQPLQASLPQNIDCLVYTAAHQGIHNPQVQEALSRNIPVFSQAEAVASLFNQKKGIAVCGVGGKSTTSAMITWILEKMGKNPSYSVGVGSIPGLAATGAWRENSEYCVAEADEYVIDPSAPSKGEAITPRFSFLKPFVTVCTNLRYDHPDVYTSFEHTQEVFLTFFRQNSDAGFLVINADDEPLLELAQQSGKKIITFGEKTGADFQLTEYISKEGTTTGKYTYLGQAYTLELHIPGKFNMLNALAALAATVPLYPEALSQNALSEFASTARRFENKGLIRGIQCFDDYAHHPNEVKSAIQALNEWYPNARKVIAFQSHTYSRTKQLFSEFVDAFAQAKEVVMIDIFSSAREQKDDSISSTILCEAIHQKYPENSAINLKTIEALAEYIQNTLQPGDVFLTVGAGDIYEVYEKIA